MKTNKMQLKYLIFSKADMTATSQWWGLAGIGELG